MTAGPRIAAFFDTPTNTVSYLVSDPETRAATVIDPVLGFDPASGVIDTAPADRILAAATNDGLAIVLVLETHPHADHVTGATVIKSRTGAKVGIGVGIREVQKTFGPMFGAKDIKTDGGDFDLLLEDGQQLALGNLTIEVIATPGHTPACVSYRIGDAVFVGDTLFMPDFGTARTDFPGGCAHRLYHSIQRLLALPGETRLFTCHDYKAPGRDQFAWETSVAEQRARNVHLGAGVGENAYVEMRRARDAQLPVPKLLLPAIQVNIRAGRFPPAEADGVSYLKIPVRMPAPQGIS